METLKTKYDENKFEKLESICESSKLEKMSSSENMIVYGSNDALICIEKEKETLMTNIIPSEKYKSTFEEIRKLVVIDHLM